MNQLAMAAAKNTAGSEGVAEAAGSLLTDPVAVLAVLLTVLAVLFATARHPVLGRVFRVIPLLLFAYFVPTVLSTTGVLPLKSPLYDFVKTWLLPSSLLLLTLSVDLPAIVRLGPRMLCMFLGATAGIVVGGPLAFLALGWLVPESLSEQAWKGLAALSGSWIGGSANFIAIGSSVGATEDTIDLMVVIDVAVASVWMAILLFFAGREKQMDAKIGADRKALEALLKKVESYQAEVSRPTSLADLLMILALGFGGTVAATWASHWLPEVGDIVGQFTWVVLLVTALGVGLSFTPVRRLDGAGASAVGSVFLYVLVATIGARGNFTALRDAPALVAVGAVWMLIHAASILLLRRLLRAPVFFAAVGSQANVGGAASAPIVAGAFHPALAPVGGLLAVAGYALGTYAGLACAVLLRLVDRLVN